jgi:hypothetical protein
VVQPVQSRVVVRGSGPGVTGRSPLASIHARFDPLVSRPVDVALRIRTGDHEGVITEITVTHVGSHDFDGEYLGLSTEPSTTSVLEFVVESFVSDGQSAWRGSFRRVTKRPERFQEFVGVVRPFPSAP